MGSMRPHGGISFCVHFVKYELVLPKHSFVLPNNRANTEKCDFGLFQHFANTSQTEVVMGSLNYAILWDHLSVCVFFFLLTESCFMAHDLCLLS